MDSQIINKSKYRVSKNMYIISIICFSFISVATYFDNIIYFTQALTALSLSIFSLILLTTTKNYKLPVYITISLSVFVHSYGFMTSSFVNNQADTFWIIVIALFSFYIVGRIGAIIYLVVNLSSMLAIKLLTINNFIELPFKSVEPHLASEINYVINLAACSVLFIYLVNQILKEFYLTQKTLITANLDLNIKDSERSAMLKEIHHRVKNNLQVIISLLRLQLFQLDHDHEASGPFQDSINRISTMALIHEKMYKGGKINDLNVKEYVSDLATDLVGTYATETKVKIGIESNIQQLKMNDLVPLSLILNELITNSIKHGFKNSKTGQIRILLKTTEVGFDLKYTDSGTWVENESDQNFGLELIDTLTGHFDGHYEISKSANGTEFIFNLKLY